ncbi:RNA polymerase recycling motor HelD [Schleiferilactobacillus perolens]|jgi:DNA helicase-2/ATP-dependent DNA helicase PcrA|uniref:RNA polymerase recycling motor HelD n=1 Tax=Schleiferilactobacillus perolens TaxID=100468 RepID=UPI0023546E3F|nr:RNA polymerase recycling motor HelD [Schleiferilactobacillus perolens]MCI2171564.1 AAA family ATPase [Schleiferilactobacillus perolens]
MAQNDQTAEQHHLDTVLEKLDTAEKKLTKQINRAKAEEKNIDEHFSDDVHLSFGSDTTNMETAINIRQQQQMLQERDNAWRNSSTQLKTVERLQKAPYFARVDFKESGEPRKETIYIGLGSFSDRNDHFLIYDWRAPISSIYYDGGLGHVTYQTPDGEQSVDVDLKRQFIIKDSQIVNMFDTTETIGDSMLLEVLGEKSSTQMKSIVTTIQREQNKIIRDTKSDLLFVQGAAGSGKTSAILQRVAYLLYRYRGNLTSSQVIMFSPNQLFNDYIENVLPELGEQNMVQMTYQQYTNRRLPNLSAESLRNQFEVQLDPDEKKIQQMMQSLNMFEATKRYADTLNRGGMHFRTIKFHGKPFFSRNRISEIYYSYNQNYKLMNRLDATKERLINSLNHRIDAETKTDWVQQAVQDLDKEALQRLYKTVDQEFENSDAEFKFLARQIVTNEFQKIYRAVQRNHFFNIRMQYIAFLKAVPELVDLAKWQVTPTMWDAHVEQVRATLSDKKIDADDVTPFLYLYDLMTGRHTDRHMRFVFIDEIQDYTAYQLAYLRDRFARARFTMLGDLNQAIFTKQSNGDLLAEVSTLFDPDKTSVVQLTKSYRSTKQITNFTKALLINGQRIDAFDRDGDLPNVYVGQDTKQLLARLEKQIQTNDADHLTTAIITRTLADSEQLADQLKDAGVASTLIKSENQRLAPGVIIVPSFLAKGLEFDAVVMWQANAANYGSDDDRQLVYTITSRAMHRLTIVASPELSPILAAVPAALYQQE